MTKPQALPVEGSIQWAMNRGERYSLWVPSGTQLTVWNVYAGEIGGFSMKDPQRFVVRRGQVFETGEIR